MAVTVANVGTVAFTSGTGTVSPSAPAGSGGLLVLSVSMPSTVGVNTPSNWTARATISQANGTRIATFDRKSDGGADDSPTVTAASGTPEMVAGIIRLAGEHATDYYDSSAAKTTVDNAIDQTGDILAFDVAVNDSLQVVAVSCSDSTPPIATWNSPLSTTQEADGGARQLLVATAARNAGNVAADTFTLVAGATGRKAVATIVYKPAAAATGHPARRRLGIETYGLEGVQIF